MITLTYSDVENVNSLLDNGTEDLILVREPGSDCVVDKDCYETVVNIFETFPRISVVYTDAVLPNGMIQYQPSFHPSIFTFGVVINTPLFIRGNSKNRFDTELSVPFYHFLIQESKRGLPWHLAMPCVTKSEDKFNHQDKDIQKCIQLLETSIK